VIGPSVVAPPMDDVELPGAVDAVGLPRVRVRTNQASGRATRIVLTLTWIMLAILVLLCLIGPHIPAGG
jgi:hypothetical protein